MPDVKEPPPRVGIDALRAVVLDLEDWSKELGAIAGFEGMAAQALESAGQVRAATETVRVKLETLDKVRQALRLPEGATRPGFLMALSILKEHAAQFEKSVTQFDATPETLEAENARLRWEVAKLNIEVQELKGTDTGESTDGNAEPLRQPAGTDAVGGDRAEGAEAAPPGAVVRGDRGGDRGDGGEALGGPGGEGGEADATGGVTPLSNR